MTKTKQQSDNTSSFTTNMWKVLDTAVVNLAGQVVRVKVQNQIFESNILMDTTVDENGKFYRSVECFKDCLRRNLTKLFPVQDINMEGFSREFIESTHVDDIDNHDCNIVIQFKDMSDEYAHLICHKTETSNDESDQHSKKQLSKWRQLSHKSKIHQVQICGLSKVLHSLIGASEGQCDISTAKSQLARVEYSTSLMNWLPIQNRLVGSKGLIALVIGMKDTVASHVINCLKAAVTDSVVQPEEVERDVLFDPFVHEDFRMSFRRCPKLTTDAYINGELNHAMEGRIDGQDPEACKQIDSTQAEASHAVLMIASPDCFSDPNLRKYWVSRFNSAVSRKMNPKILALHATEATDEEKHAFVKQIQSAIPGVEVMEQTTHTPGEKVRDPQVLKNMTQLIRACQESVLRAHDLDVSILDEECVMRFV